MANKTLYYQPYHSEIQDQSRELVEILQRNNTYGFETPGGTDKDTIHAYTGAYEFLLAPYKNREINLLEVGVQFGGSSLLWHDYLQNAKLALVDLVPWINYSIVQRMSPDRFKFYVCDGYADESVAKVVADFPGGFDVAIDDGPHTLESQVLFIQKYLPHMRKGGVMIIEDIQSQEDLNVLLDTVPDELKFNARVIDLRSIKGRYDDLMFILHT